MGIFEKIMGNKGQPLVEDTEESLAIEKAERDKRIQGKIIKVDPRGFGFITSGEIPFERIFFHWTSLKRNTLKFPALRRGMFVEFVARHQGNDNEGNDRGYKAIRIMVLTDIPIDTTGTEDDND